MIEKRNENDSMMLVGRSSSEEPSDERESVILCVNVQSLIAHVQQEVRGLDAPMSTEIQSEYCVWVPGVVRLGASMRYPCHVGSLPSDCKYAEAAPCAGCTCSGLEEACLGAGSH